LAGGDVDVTMIIKSVLQARGSVNVSGNVIENSLLVARGGFSVDGNVDATSTVRQDGPDPLQIIALFDTKQVGVQLGIDAFKKGVRIDGVEEGKPFAAAGLHKGDQVLAVNGKPTEAVQDFRRLVRRSLVESGEATLQINRAGKTFDAKVVFKR
jgi:S1-C subfamily serine protease